MSKKRKITPRIVVIDSKRVKVLIKNKVLILREIIFHVEFD